MMLTRDIELFLNCRNGAASTDRSGNGVSPTYNNATGLDSIFEYPPVAQKSIDTNATGGLEYAKALLGTPGSLGAGAFTISMWFRLEDDGTANNQWLFATTDNSGSARGIQLYVNRSTMLLRARIKKVGSAWWEVNSTTAINYNTWYHVAVTSPDDTTTGGFKIAVNGQVEDNMTLPDYRDADLHDVKIARGYSNATTMDGQVSCIKVYTRAVAAGDLERLRLGLQPLH